MLEGVLKLANLPTNQKAAEGVGLFRAQAGRHVGRARDAEVPEIGGGNMRRGGSWSEEVQTVQLSPELVW